MALNKSHKTALAAVLATTFFAGASMVAHAADPSAATAPSPTGSGVNSQMESTAPSNVPATSDSMMRNESSPASPTGSQASQNTGSQNTGSMSTDRSATASGGGMSGSSTSSTTDRSASSSRGSTATAATEDDSMRTTDASRHGKWMHRSTSHKRTAYRGGRGDPEGDRAVTALNTLMAAGYESYSDFQADGRNFSAYATRNGSTERVIIDPESRSVTPNG